jgi:hypothetical protein
LIHLLTDVSTRLPATFKAAIETVIADCISGIDDKSTTLSFVIATGRIETYPTTWSMFTLAR